MEALNKAIIFISNYNLLIVCWITQATFSTNKDKSLAFYFSFLGTFFAGIFFLMHSLFAVSYLSGTEQINPDTMLFAGTLILFLPYVWLSIVFWFFDINKKMGVFPFIIIIILFLLESVYFFASREIFYKKNFVEIYFASDHLWKYSFCIYLLIFTLPATALFQIRTLRNAVQSTSKKNHSFVFMRNISIYLAILSVGVTILFSLPGNFIERASSELVLKFSDILFSILVILTLIEFGKANVTFDIFSNKSLPSGELKIEWEISLKIAGLLSIFVTILSTESIWQNLGFEFFSILILSTRQNLFHSQHKKNRERELFLRTLLNENLTETIFGRNDNNNKNLEHSFTTLASNVIQSSFACLIPMDRLLYTEEDILIYDNRINSVDENLYKNKFRDPDFKRLYEFIIKIQTNASDPIFLDREHFTEISLAIPLYSGNEKNGFLVLGDKVFGGIYTREEIDFARMAGEKILETLLATRIGKIVITLQSEAILANRLIDLKVRRALHDEVLPEIHSILLSIDSMELNSLKTTLVDLHKKVSSILIQIPSEHFQKEKSSLLDALMKLSKSEFSEDEMEWRIENNLDAKINSLNERSQELIYFAVKEVFRNIIKYAKIKDKKLFIIIEMKSNLEYLYISIQDNGGKIDLINNKSGAGQGLAIHSALLATIGGNLQRDTIAGKSSTVRIKVPF